MTSITLLRALLKIDLSTGRDRREGLGSIAGFPVNVIDTGGFDDRGSVTSDIHHQIDKAIQSADVILFLLDARAGINQLDESFAKWIRKKIGKVQQSSNNHRKIDILVLANKTEGSHLSNKVLDAIADAYELGLGDPIPISASHGDGMSDLRELLYSIATSRGNIQLESEEKTRHSKSIGVDERTIQIAIMGQPNVGKSSILNAIVGDERVITGPIAGLTRDSIPVTWSYNDRKFCLVDTAGLTRIRTSEVLLNKSVEEKAIERLRDSTGKLIKVKIPKLKYPGAEYMDPEADPSQFSSQVSELALMSSLEAMKYAQIVLLVVEGSQGQFSKIDLQLAER
jgi:GTPase